MIHNGVSKRTIILFGVRFRMRFEGEEALERRFTGTIVRCENLDPLWPDSSWRYLKNCKLKNNLALLGFGWPFFQSQLNCEIWTVNGH
ncbi:hypothetical protein BDA96_06G050000 [Sorghum bicolor]|uniref:Auxin response factor domain-containing protein n=2 Tax=Sorghum bicolor TaxID=4558 RepID=A0A921QNJ7_SORBI|nr:auxin response factor 7 isoform X1 [Sorghum bicolor]KAG0525364.1 hypothetical protein BDA96_06G050000 [Sorghum bicolor]OQU81354.1 hypothetical protein SORBI_3006G045901 [Sorghum bicolor]|eukprot:XP_021319561.1 auxin response factor 7 isoform X1 [Sorghum bicolor]